MCAWQFSTGCRPAYNINMNYLMHPHTCFTWECPKVNKIFCLALCCFIHPVLMPILTPWQLGSAFDYFGGYKWRHKHNDVENIKRYDKVLIIFPTDLFGDSLNCTIRINPKESNLDILVATQLVHIYQSSIKGSVSNGLICRP